jgi:hypothetical protein
LASDTKKAEEETFPILWGDEAGFSVVPMAVRTWAPRGQTPIVRVTLTRDHLSAISGIIVDGRLFMHVRKASSDAQAVSGFLRVLLRTITGTIVIIWDGSPIHRTKDIKAFLKAGAATRLHREHLPGSAPDLNSDEGMWQDLTRVERGTVCCTDLDHLSQQVIRARERLRHTRDIIGCCSTQCGSLLSCSITRSVSTGLRERNHRKICELFNDHSRVKSRECQDDNSKTININMANPLMLLC